MYYSKATSRPTLHTADCPHCRRIAPENLRHIQSIGELAGSDFHYCLTCDPMAELMKKEEAALAEYCASNGISFRKSRRGLRLTTPRSEWQIICDGEHTQLYHHNDLNRKKDSPDLIPGFHDQKVSFASLVEYCEYIVNHDYYRMLNPLYAKPPKAPPMKGTKRYRKEQKKAEQRMRRKTIANVHRLIRTLSIEPGVAALSV